MRPTSRELIERIAQALNDTVLPAVADDKWSASVVRSATTLLNHLAQRVEREAPVLLADNEDARKTLGEVAEHLRASKLSDTLRGALDAVLRDDAVVPPYDAIALDARNRAYQDVMEKLLRGLYEAARQNSPEAKVRRILRDYLERRRARERDIYFPAFVGPPF